MSTELKAFLLNLGENPDLAARFRKDPGQVMDASNLSIDTREQIERDTRNTGRGQDNFFIIM